MAGPLHWIARLSPQHRGRRAPDDFHLATGACPTSRGPPGYRRSTARASGPRRGPAPRGRADRGVPGPGGPGFPCQSGRKPPAPRHRGSKTRSSTRHWPAYPRWSPRPHWPALSQGLDVRVADSDEEFAGRAGGPAFTIPPRRQSWPRQPVRKRGPATAWLAGLPWCAPCSKNSDAHPTRRRTRDRLWKTP